MTELGIDRSNLERHIQGLGTVAVAKTASRGVLGSTIRTLRIRLRPMNCFTNVPAVERAVFGQLARWHLLPELTQSS